MNKFIMFKMMKTIMIISQHLFCAGIDLENIVYYKDDTHYFVMTAKKQSLLDKGVILRVSVMSCAFICI